MASQPVEKSFSRFVKQPAKFANSEFVSAIWNSLEDCKQCVAHRHDTVCEVEGLLDTIPMMNVNVHVQYSLIVLEQLQDSKHDVVHVAKARGFSSLCMVHASCPVECDFCLPLHQVQRSVPRSAGVQLQEMYSLHTGHV